jgi:hypothetical protein
MGRVAVERPDQAHLSNAITGKIPGDPLSRSAGRLRPGKEFIPDCVNFQAGDGRLRQAANIREGA